MRLRAASLLLIGAAACGGSAAELPATAPQPTAYDYTTELIVTVKRPLGDLSVVGTRTGTFVAPGTHSVVSEVSGTDFDLGTERVIIIGDRAYYDGGGGFVATTPDDPAVSGVTGVLTSVGTGILPGDDLYGALRELPAQEDGELIVYLVDESGLDVVGPGLQTEGLRTAVATADSGSLRVAFDASTGVMTTFHLNLLGVDDFFSNSAGIELNGIVDLELTIEVGRVNDGDLAVAAPSTVASALGTRTFGGPGFVIDHPADWILAPPDGAAGSARTVAGFRPPAARAGTEVNVVVEPTQATLADYVDSSLSFAGELAGFELLSDEIVELRNATSRIIEFAAAPGGTRITTAQAYVVTGAEAIIVTYRATPDDYARFFEPAILMMASLELT